MADTTSDLDLSAPIPTLVTGSDGVAGSAPAPSLVAGATGVAGSAPAPTLSSTVAQANNTFIGSAPVPALSCSGLAGEAITFAGIAPVPTLESHTKDVRATVPAPTLSATLVPGTLITVEANVAAPILVATLDNPAIITAASTIPPIRLSSSLAAGQLVTAALTLRAPTLSAQILTGNVATVLASVVAPTMSAAGHPAYTITFSGTVPAPRLDATLSAVVTAAFRTWCLNMKKGALTEYGSEWAMNSYAFFNGKFLGCTSSGIVELGTQALDNATAIDSTVKSGKDNFGTSVHKRIPRIYLDYTTDGDAQFALITTEGGTRRYALNWNNVTGTQTRRIPVGQGPKSSRWQWEYMNVGGADFDLGAVLAYPKKLRRRVQ